MIPVIYEDKNLLIIDKPAGVDIEQLGLILAKEHPALESLGESLRYGIAHRLDKDTSGVLLIAKTKEEFEKLQTQFKNREIQKEYIALVHGVPKESKGVMEARLDRAHSDRRKQKGFLPGEKGYENAREAKTDYAVEKEYKEGYTLLRLFPHTGRKHQLRAHLSHKGFPIVGDTLYAFKGKVAPKILTRQFLHATSLKLDNTTYTAPLPQDLSDVLYQLHES